MSDSLPDTVTNSALALEVIKLTAAAGAALDAVTTEGKKLITHMDSAEAHGRGDIAGNAGTATRLETARNIALTGDFSAGLYIAATVAGTTTLSAPTAPAGGCATVLLELTNGGNHAVTWGMSPRWSNGVAPVLTANGVDLVALTYRNSRWIGALIASNAR